MPRPDSHENPGPSIPVRDTDAAFTVSAPKVELPAGGGAIRGIGEKFGANPVTGTGSMTVPIATSPGRNGFGPQLALSYDSGSGNGPFGFGWSLSLPRITRKTDKGLPRYDDADESDVFILSDAEDLVPMLGADGKRFDDRAAAPGYVIHRYRPRIEGAFTRIERWTRATDGDVHWRTLSRDNVLTVYGKDRRSRIFDPLSPIRVFTWLICESRDDRGNVVAYDYKPEDAAGVDLSRAHERNRGEADDPRRCVNRYLKRICYANRAPLLDPSGKRPLFVSDEWTRTAGWLFEVVFDYGEHDLSAPRPGDTADWIYRRDPFSTCRPGFEVRTGRRCRRVLMFHHFEEEPEVGIDCLVRSTDFTYADERRPSDSQPPSHSFLASVTQCGYRRSAEGYLRSSMPPAEFDYSLPAVQGVVRDVDERSLDNMPAGLDGSHYQWLDLHGEGTGGLFSGHGEGWYYKRNLSPVSELGVEFAALERVNTSPNASLSDGRGQLVDVVGDGRPDLVMFDGPSPGVYEHDVEEGWQSFRPFQVPLGRSSSDPNLRFVDLDGDGRPDVLISEDDVFIWHQSRGAEGFGPANRVALALEEEQGPRLLFADPAQSIFLADMNADGLTDLVRVRNGEVCYWPNLGYGSFGGRVAMDASPCFDQPDLFDPRRIRLADIDGCGAVDLIYLASTEVTIYFNQSGNAWSEGQRVMSFPAVDNLAAIQVADLMGNGTACLIWSSPLPGQAMRPMRFVDLMGGQKPHLLVRATNNLGAETVMHYAASTKFYLADKLAGTPWITRVPFPVHVVERVETIDCISGNRFVTRYAYHHGYFDGVEREFRGFGMVEQWDTEEYGVLAAHAAERGVPTNVDERSHVPPVLTRTWFHTGVHVGRDSVSNFFAGSPDGERRTEYYTEPGAIGTEAATAPLPDSVLPPGLSLDEEREACRALKGAMLRQEIYGLDGTDLEQHPYAVTEQNFTVRRLQPKAANCSAVFQVHPREALTHHYERQHDDPRVAHALTLEIDAFGNVLKSATVVYGRRKVDSSLTSGDRARQSERHVTLAENAFTNPIDASTDYRLPLASDSCAYELGGLEFLPGETRFGFDQMLRAFSSSAPIPYEMPLLDGLLQKRLVEHARTLYRPNDCGDSQRDPLALLPRGTLESLALTGERYRMAFTPGLLTRCYGERADEAMLSIEGAYVHSENSPEWWQCSGRVFLSPGTSDGAGAELAHAQAHFFQPCRFRDPFHRSGFQTEAVVTYDQYDLSIEEGRDALNDVITAVSDYRVLRPRLLTDVNGNRTEAAFDTLGRVVATAVAGKDGENSGDTLAGLTLDLSEPVMLAQFADPLADPTAILQGATVRTAYDQFAYMRTRADATPQPPSAWTMMRETHAGDLANGAETRIQHTFSHSDGFGREIQKKVHVGAGPLTPGGTHVDPRWVGNGWTIFNNKGKPVRKYEAFFSATHRFEFARAEGVSPTLFYDPPGRQVGTLYPDHTWTKLVIGPWRQETWDRNDTSLPDNPADDVILGGYFNRLPDEEYLPGWNAQRAGGALGVHEQTAAARAAVHAGTPTVAHMDSMGRAFLSVSHNRFTHGDALPADPPVDQFNATRVVFDVEGNQRDIIDALGRIVVHFDYDMLGNVVHTASMEAGERWSLSDVAGRALCGWDSRGHRLRTGYDVLGRPVGVHLQIGTAPEILVNRTVYGEQVPGAESRNLRGRTHMAFDCSGVVTSERYDFKGNLLTSSRRLAADYKSVADWSGSVPLDPDIFTATSTFDALNRPVTESSPDSSIIRRGYDDAGLLESVDVNLRGESDAAGQPVWRAFVTDIDYNAKGQHERITYGNGVSTTSSYDPLTFRLVRLTTTRDGARIQDLSYTYDPVGNLTHLEDGAQQAIYFRNTRVEPSSDYVHDATYQLIEATAREHLGQANDPTPPVPFDRFHLSSEHPGDGNAMGRYLERYVYDLVGNILEVQHVGTDPAHPGWTRTYDYQEESLLEAGKMSNRLTTTKVGREAMERYTYDVHGSMASMTHLPVMRWDYRDRLESSSRQTVESGTAETTYYVYDASGRRVRKVTEREGDAGVEPVRMKERLYLGGLEIYREYDAAGRTVTLERETLHVISDENPFALVDTRTRGEDATPARLIRYQLANHAHSVSIELDDRGDTISYQEYYPYGSTSYQAGSLAGTTMAARYLFTGRERDEESGLYYHGARYYAPWLGRWTSCDPLGTQGGICLYAYVRNSPALRTDPEGTQDSAMRASMEVYYARLERDVEGYITGWLGGHADVNMSQNKVEYETPEGGVGGVIGGILRVLSDRLLPFEEHPTPESVLGAEVGAGLVPVMDPSQRLALGTTVTGQPTSRLAAGVQLALDVVPTIVEIRMASAPARTASVVSHASSLERAGLLGQVTGEAVEGMASASRAASAPGGLPVFVARDVSSSSATARRVRELVVPLWREEKAKAGTVERALRVARERGATAVWLEEMGNFSDVERVTFVGHANEVSFAGRSAEDLAAMVGRAGLNPQVIELAGCETARGEALISRDLAFYSGSDVVGYDRPVHMGSGVVSDALVMTDLGWDPLIPSPATPTTFKPPLRVPR